MSVESALSSADIGSMKARIESLEEISRVRRGEVDARVARLEAELHSVREMQRLSIKQLYAELQKLGGVAPAPRRSQGIGDTLSNIGFVLVKWFGLGIATMSEPLSAIYPYVAPIACCRRLARKAASTSSAIHAENEHVLAGGGAFGSGVGSAGSVMLPGTSSTSTLHSSATLLAPHAHADRYTAGNVGTSSSGTSHRNKGEVTIKGAQPSMRSGFDSRNGVGSSIGTSSGSNIPPHNYPSLSRESSALVSRGGVNTSNGASVGGLARRSHMTSHSRPSSSLTTQRDVDREDEYSTASAAASAAAAAAAAAAALSESEDDLFDGDSSRLTQVQGRNISHSALHSLDDDTSVPVEEYGVGVSDSERSTHSDMHPRFAGDSEEQTGVAGINPRSGRDSGTSRSSRRDSSNAISSSTSSTAAGGGRSRPLSVHTQARSTMAQLRNASKALAGTRRT
jgi:hypothetical protein